MSSFSALGVGAGSNALYINTSNAYVGVGKSNPAYQLDVVGSINCTGSVLVNGAALTVSGGGGGGAASVCQALWYTTSNVPASNYIGMAAHGGVISQNNTTTSTAPFATATGLFTCQYTGSYQCNFTSTISVAQAAVTIYRNGAAIAPGYLCYGNFNNSISLSAAVYCNAADTLGFYVTSGAVQSATQGCSIALSSSGSAATGMGVPNQVVVTATGSGSWTVPSGVTVVQVEAVGGGGGGSGGANISPYTGAGGGAGSYTRAIISVTPGSSVTYTVGAGGAGGIYAAGGGYPGGSGTQTTISSTNVTLKTNGGSGAGAYSASVDAQGGAGGVYTNTVTGNITSCLDVQGGDGYWIGNTACGGNGGCSYFGGPGKAAQVNVQSFNANNSAAYGAGGSGGRATSNSSAGANGVVIITYFTQSGVPATYTATAPLSMSGTTLSLGVGNGLAVNNGALTLAVKTGTIANVPTGTSGALYYATDTSSLLIYGTQWMYVPIAYASLGTSAQPGTNASAIMTTSNGTATSGLYYITNPSGGSVQVYCDMTTAGGGWHLVTRCGSQSAFGYTAWNGASDIEYPTSSTSMYSVLRRVAFPFRYIMFNWDGGRVIYDYGSTFSGGLTSMTNVTLTRTSTYSSGTLPTSSYAYLGAYNAATLYVKYGTQSDRGCVFSNYDASNKNQGGFMEWQGFAANLTNGWTSPAVTVTFFEVWIK